MFLTAVEEMEIIDLVNECESKTSADYNDIDSKTMKNVIGGIVKPLTYICNLSFLTGTFPNQMKIAKVVPLFKTGDKHSFTNYRPVSLLSQFSKILEKLFSKRLDLFLDKGMILSDSQYGFRSNRSTSLALMDTVEEITNAIDRKHFAVGIFLDLQKAFYTIDHNILINKLERYRIRGIVLKWLTSYLSHRKQFVKVGQFSSTYLDIAYGVPQGSVLGPKLFILYINDICKVSEILKFVMFADDTNIFCSGEKLNKLMEILSAEMFKVKKWFDKNKLSLNLSKTKYMLFGNNKVNTQIVMNIDGVTIERVNHYKFLGVIMNDKISWKQHIKHVHNKTVRSISILNKVKHFLDRNILHMLYCALVQPYLNYCAEVWGNTYKTTLSPIIILQKKAIRIINKAGYRDHTNNLFLKSRVLKFTDLVQFLTLQIIYKANDKLLPGNIQNYFLYRDKQYNLREEWNLNYLSVRTTVKSQCISVCGVQLWNGLNSDLKQCP
uniref:Reverse transcriptase domain-containing protein n=1 Tax=Nothobranchius furzeri TaxID=105023 RepID=A0A8C6M9A3_NOTFU